MSEDLPPPLPRASPPAPEEEKHRHTPDRPERGAATPPGRGVERIPSAAGAMRAPVLRPRAVRAPLVPEQRAERRTGPIPRRMLPAVGFAVFAAAVAAYIRVGLATHFLVGLAAALALVAVLGGAVVLLSRDRAGSLRALCRGMGYGLAVLAAAALLSIAIALATAA